MPVGKHNSLYMFDQMAGEGVPKTAVLLLFVVGDLCSTVVAEVIATGSANRQGRIQKDAQYVNDDVSTALRCAGSGRPCASNSMCLDVRHAPCAAAASPKAR